MRLLNRSASIAIDARKQGLTPGQAAERVEGRICSRCISQHCHGCPVDQLVARLRQMSKWPEEEVVLA